MGLVMLRVDHLTLEAIEALPDPLAHPELFLEPERHRFQEGWEAGRGEGEVGLQESLELQEGLVIEGYIRESCRIETCLLKAVPDSGFGKAVIVLLPCEALLLRGCYYLPVLYEAGSGIVIKGRYTENTCFYGFLLTSFFFSVRIAQM